VNRQAATAVWTVETVEESRGLEATPLKPGANETDKFAIHMKRLKPGASETKKFAIPIKK
jgi:hypothetical protein